MRTQADLAFASMVQDLLIRGEKLVTRNSAVYREFAPFPLTFTSFPIVTVRKTAWKKALREMEWFLSGNERCPEELKDWWNGQLNKQGLLVDGYSGQFRGFAYTEGESYDQIKGLLEGLKKSPFSRRHVLTVWNPGDMAFITQTNENPNTPTCCHGTMVQFSVSKDSEGNQTLNAYHYQRSADILLGLLHNFAQYWALLTYFAHHSGMKVGSLKYQVGDLHLYDEPSHVEVAVALSRWSESPDQYPSDTHAPKLVYNYCGEVDSTGVPVFKASDFSIEGDISPPVTTVRPKLL